MGPPSVVAREVVIEHRLHFINGFKPIAPSLDSAMLVKQGAMEAFKDTSPATANRARKLLRSAPGSDGDLGRVIAVKGHIAIR